ncbi:hypothetical protein BJ322DRAFT_1018827 [Thelephora terrestris]|uniref:Uncharacterized protein n=1 Tax=Thelephora terrestris TaxID=56493 RepID=A0A9P6L9A0_9AGAM|nr:hypothetical protein BJ322DRAFT_1018827 [Thelephora terrestris]
MWQAPPNISDNRFWPVPRGEQWIPDYAVAIAVKRIHNSSDPEDQESKGLREFTNYWRPVYNRQVPRCQLPCPNTIKRTSSIRPNPSSVHRVAPMDHKVIRRSAEARFLAVSRERYPAALISPWFGTRTVRPFRAVTLDHSTQGLRVHDLLPHLLIGILRYGKCELGSNTPFCGSRAVVKTSLYVDRAGFRPRFTGIRVLRVNGPAKGRCFHNERNGEAKVRTHAVGKFPRVTSVKGARANLCPFPRPQEKSLLACHKADRGLLITFASAFLQRQNADLTNGRVEKFISFGRSKQSRKMNRWIAQAHAFTLLPPGWNVKESIRRFSRRPKLFWKPPDASHSRSVVRPIILANAEEALSPRWYAPQSGMYFSVEFSWISASAVAYNSGFSRQSTSSCAHSLAIGQADVLGLGKSDASLLPAQLLTSFSPKGISAVSPFSGVTNPPNAAFLSQRGRENRKKTPFHKTKRAAPDRPRKRNFAPSGSSIRRWAFDLPPTSST